MKTKNPELIGKRIGRLVVLSYVGWVDVGSQKVQKWRCQCDCGTVADVAKQRLINTAPNRSCGCYRGESIRRASASRAGHPDNNLVGIQVGKLKVLEPVGICPLSIGTRQIHYLWRCQCSCGQTVDVRGSYLTRKVKPRRTCGKCRKPKPVKFNAKPRSTAPRLPVKPRAPRVALASTLTVPEMIEIVQSELADWLRLEYASIYRRCNDEDHKYYHLFGGSGITLAWDNPDCFVEWTIRNLGSRAVGTKILRIDRYGDFEPGNLRYASDLLGSRFN